MTFGTATPCADTAATTRSAWGAPKFDSHTGRHPNEGDRAVGPLAAIERARAHPDTRDVATSIGLEPRTPFPFQPRMESGLPVRGTPHVLHGLGVLMCKFNSNQQRSELADAATERYGMGHLTNVRRRCILYKHRHLSAGDYFSA